MRLFLFIYFFFARPTDPPSREGGRWETKHFIGMALLKFTRTFCEVVVLFAMEASCSGCSEFDETRESIESLKNESEKLGNPHCGHIHVSEVLARISYIDKSALLHLAWYQTSHMSHFIPLWLSFTGLVHSPQGCLY